MYIYIPSTHINIYMISHHVTTFAEPAPRAPPAPADDFELVLALLWGSGLPDSQDVTRRRQYICVSVCGADKTCVRCLSEDMRTRVWGG